MRIRSIKPEFWKSEDIHAIGDWGVRLLFVGLWSYVDDNGVGRDVEKLITAELFPLEDDPRETLATVSRGLQKLSELGRITRYCHEGRAYLYITNWEKHQRIDKPAKPRYPLPTCENVELRDSLPESSRDTPETVAPGAVDQGSGIRDQVLAPAAEPRIPRASSKGTRIPDPFIVDEAMRDWAIDRGYTGEWCMQQTERFINYWTAKPGKDGVKSDWRATWRNWILKAADDLPRNRTNQDPDLFGRAMQRAAEREAQQRLEIVQ